MDKTTLLKVIINILITSLIIKFLIDIFEDVGLFFAIAVTIASWLISRTIVIESSKITGRDKSIGLGLILPFHIIIPIIIILFSGILRT